MRKSPGCFSEAYKILLLLKLYPVLPVLGGYLQDNDIKKEVVSERKPLFLVHFDKVRKVYYYMGYKL